MMNKGLEALGTPNISKTMSAFYQIGDAPVLIRDWNDNYGKRQIELKPLHQAREEQYEIIEKELKALEIIKETPEFAWYVKTYKDAYEMITDVKGFRVGESAEELQEKFDLLKEVLL